MERIRHDFSDDLPPERIAMTRIVDDEASSAEWEEFCARAERVPSLWRELAEEHWMARRLSRAVDAQVARAGAGVSVARCEARGALEAQGLRDPQPMPHMSSGLTSAARAGDDRAHEGHPRASHGGWFRAGWSGWMAAACLAGAWVVTDSLRTPFGMTPISTGSAMAPKAHEAPGGAVSPGGTTSTSPGRAHAPAGGGAPAVEPPTIMRASLTPDEALDAYFVAGKADGSVLGEVPGMPVVERRAAPDGGYDVIYIRQILERRRVPAFFTFEQTDEFGRPVPTPVTATAPREAKGSAF